VEDFDGDTMGVTTELFAGAGWLTGVSFSCSNPAAVFFNIGLGFGIRDCSRRHSDDGNDRNLSLMERHLVTELNMLEIRPRFRVLGWISFLFLGVVSLVGLMNGELLTLLFSLPVVFIIWVTVRQTEARTLFRLYKEGSALVAIPQDADRDPDRAFRLCLKENIDYRVGFGRLLSIRHEGLWYRAQLSLDGKRKFQSLLQEPQGDKP
jgi:hypothetical protein